MFTFISSSAVQNMIHFIYSTSCHFISIIGYITNSQWLAVQSAFKSLVFKLHTVATTQRTGSSRNSWPSRSCLTTRSDRCNHVRAPQRSGTDPAPTTSRSSGLRAPSSPQKIGVSSSNPFEPKTHYRGVAQRSEPPSR